MSEQEIRTMFKRWSFLQEAREALTLQDTDLKAEIEQIKFKISDLMEKLGTTSMKFPEATIYMQASAYAKLLQDPEKVIEWFDALKVNVAPRTVKLARIKEYLETCMDQDLPFPPSDMIDATPVKELRMRKAKASKGDSSQ